MKGLSAEVATYSDLDSFVKHKGLDAVYIATPNHLHKPHVIACKKAGLHILCEKPLATNAEDAEEMMAFLPIGKMGAKAQKKKCTPRPTISVFTPRI